MAATVSQSPCALTTTQHIMESEISLLEDRLKQQAQTKRIRVSEFFKDFDPLRSGYITKSQFRRSMDQHLGLPLSDEEYQKLSSRYDTKENGMINYRMFADALENAFNPDILDGSPAKQIENFQKTSSALTFNTLSPETKDITDQLLHKCAQYYKSRGISVRLCYQDFDRHRMGYVTLSQFHRSFPGPPEISENDISLLAERYYDPTTRLYNYLRLNSDIKCLCERQGLNTIPLIPKPPSPTRPQVASVEEIFQHIRDVVYKNGIRTTEFFRDHDKLRSGIITENQFICGLSLCLGQRAQLQREEIHKIVEHYRSSDGRVKYKEFCDLMENTYNEPNLEKRPTQTVYRPLRGQLHRPLNSLSSYKEECQLEGVLNRLRGEVRKKRLLLYPYFRDFDRGKGYTRGVTKPQFERVLHFACLSVTPEEMNLIMRKFEDPIGGDINYSAFIQAVDEDYTGQVVEEKEDNENPVNAQITNEPPMESVDVCELISRIQEHVLVNRIRVCEHFQDFDPLRSGSISAARFRQGLSSLGQPHLTTVQFNALCEAYSDPKHPGNIAWKNFLFDVDKVFEHWPEEPCNKLDLIPLGGVDFKALATDYQKEVLHTVIQRLKDRVSQRRVLVKPCFQDFDKHNMGYVTRSQFHQCLSYLELPASEEEMAIMQLRFSNNKGFNYLQFLSELQPSIPLENKYEQRLLTISSDKKRAELFEECGHWSGHVEGFVDQVMNRIKTKVSKERVRVLEFMKDYDKLRSGRIPVTSFRRALDLCGFELNKMEVNALEEKYQSHKDPSCVDYMKFSDEIESIFTVKELEKMPTAEVCQFVPPEEVDLNQLSPEEDQILQKCMHRIAERVRIRRIQLFPLFEDYDRVHIGSVTNSQFRRVLSELELGGLVSDLEFGLMFNKFGVQVGGRNDVYYIAFCGMVEEYAQSRWNDPALK